MDDYDDPSTFRGQLQRGRGIAFRQAQSLAGAGDAVYECILDDPRWDRQTEARDAYLAGLVRRLNLPLTPLEEHLSAFDDDDPDDIGLLVGVVAVLAAAGSQDAVDVLRRHVRGGKHWSTALNTVLYTEPMDAPGVLDELAAEALACRTDAELQNVIEDGDDDWMRAELMRRRRVELSNTKNEPRPIAVEYRRQLQAMADLPRGELLDIVAQGARRRWALEELGRRGDQIVLDLVEDPSLRNAAGWIPGAAQALKRLGAAAVPRARLWVSDDPAIAELGLRVLAADGDHRDVPGLISALQQAFDDDSLWCFAEIPAEGLGRLQVAEAAPLLQAGWERTVHSHARAPFLTALHRCAPQAAEILADEGRDDCEPTVQEIAAAIRQL